MAAEPRPQAPRPRARSRVAQALICPYCRDDVTRAAAVTCASRRCGALYHRDCWDECAKSFGGCAIYGCDGVASREITRTGYALAVVRLFVAALLSPPRAVKKLGEATREQVEAIDGYHRRYWRKLGSIFLLGVVSAAMLFSEIPFVALLGLILAALVVLTAIPLLVYGVFIFVVEAVASRRR